MPRLPTAVHFACESCGRRATLRQLRRRFGKCKRCDGQSWSVTASYTDIDRQVSLFGVLALLAGGVGWPYSVKKYTNQVTATNVSADVVTELAEKRSLLKSRVRDYLRIREQETLRNRGAVFCEQCGVLFVPSEHKPWTQQGYCSKACAAPGESPIFDLPAEKEIVTSRRTTINVICPSGHEFDVLASFSGCLRPCPVCAKKCLVP